MQKNTALQPSFWLLISIFFFWGFVASSNTILIPLFKKSFDLQQWQSQLVDSAFYAAYFFGALLYFFWSMFLGDPLNKIGYKKGLMLGLGVSAIGALGFVPAASEASFALMLAALFVVALGFTLQQIVANPYVIALGEPETGAHRASLAGGINSLGTTIGPLLVSYAIFGELSGQGINQSLEAVKVPYMVLALAFVLFAVLLGLSKLPSIQHAEPLERDLGALRFPKVWWGMLAIFIYVGVEVSVQSNLPELMRQPQILGKEAEETVHFISLYWGSLMIGRWMGAVKVFVPAGRLKQQLNVLLPFVAFAVVIGVNMIKDCPIEDLLYYTPFIFLLIFAHRISGDRPAEVLLIFGLSGLALMVLGCLTTGLFSLYAFLSAGLFCSVLWPCIFALTLEGLGKYTNQASSLLIMMILGGALIPPFQGWMADKMGIQASYWVAALCFGYLAWFGQWHRLRAKADEI
jgi:FHS family L-fucose permease-like MFS transporter